MERTIISHDVASAKARVRFEHNGVKVEDDVDLKLVVPGSMRIFGEMGIEFTEEYQLRALDKLTDNVQRQIEDGVITNPPEPQTPAYEEAPASVEPEAPAAAEEPTEENTAPEA